jgi:hypothetical protein
LIDLQGRTVGRLASGEFAAGEHSLSLAREGLYAGVYWLRLRVGSEVCRTRFAVMP